MRWTVAGFHGFGRTCTCRSWVSAPRIGCGEFKGLVIGLRTWVALWVPGRTQLAMWRRREIRIARSCYN